MAAPSDAKSGFTCSTIGEEIMRKSKGRGLAPSLDLVAGNGLIHRRALLGQGFAIAGAGASPRSLVPPPSR